MTLATRLRASAARQLARYGVDATATVVTDPGTFSVSTGARTGQVTQEVTVRMLPPYDRKERWQGSLVRAEASTARVITAKSLAVAGTYRPEIGWRIALAGETWQATVVEPVSAGADVVVYLLTLEAV